ncbi:putative ethylene-responsive transcription factor 4-like [Capsicum annuum]|nr:putative ethylene-responsive transcription factor 4-like [Capsicum annuum]
MKIIGENSGNREYIAVDYSGYYANSLIVTTKGWDREFFYVLKTKIIINFSRNRFEGYLPSITGDLVGLRTLNLSHNGLEGIIPASLQHLSVLESLDLSSNKIGEKQFDMFEKSSYQGNDGLRGLPLSKDCGGNYGVPQATTLAELDEEEEGDLISWQAVLLGYGCGLVIDVVTTRTGALAVTSIPESEGPERPLSICNEVYKSDIPRAIWNPPLTRRGSLQPEDAARVGVPESDTPHDT